MVDQSLGVAENFLGSQQFTVHNVDVDSAEHHFYDQVNEDWLLWFSKVLMTINVIYFQLSNLRRISCLQKCIIIKLDSIDKLLINIEPPPFVKINAKSFLLLLIALILLFIGLILVAINIDLAIPHMLVHRHSEHVAAVGLHLFVIDPVWIIF